MLLTSGSPQEHSSNKINEGSLILDLRAGELDVYSIVHVLDK